MYINSNIKLKVIYIGTSYSSPKGRFVNEDGSTSYITNGQSGSCDYFSVAIPYQGGHATITRTASDSTKIYVLSIVQNGTNYDFKELTNDDTIYYQELDGPISVVAI